MRNSFIHALAEQASKDPGLYLITGDLGFGVLTDFAERFPAQYINAGISEQNMASVAAGLALSGNTVYLYSLSNFPTLRCLEQIRNDICYHNANVKIIAVGGAMAYGQLGMSHHATEDLAIMRALPNMRIFAPADPMEAAAVFEEVHKTEGPCYVRLEKNGPQPLHPEQPAADICRVQRLSQGSDLCLLASGSVLEEVMIASGLLREHGLSVGVCSVPCLKPLDEETLRDCAANCRLLVSVEEHNVIGGLGGAIAEVLSGMPGSHAMLLRCGLEDTYSGVVGSQTYLRKQYRLDGKAVAERILELLGCMA